MKDSFLSEVVPYATMFARLFDFTIASAVVIIALIANAGISVQFAGVTPILFLHRTTLALMPERHWRYRPSLPWRSLET